MSVVRGLIVALLFVLAGEIGYAYYKHPIIVTVDNPEFCEVAQSIGGVYRLRARVDQDILIPGKTEEEAKLFASLGVGIVVKQEADVKLEPVILDGCK